MNRLQANLWPLVVGLIGLCGLPGTAGATFRVADGFDPSADGTAVRAAAIQSDGRILLGGDFLNVSQQQRFRLARLFPDGSVDPSLTTPVNGTVFAIALQADGKIVIGGAFSQVGTMSRSNIARLNSDGTVDTGFVSNVNGSVQAILVQNDGKVVVGGAFSAVGLPPSSMPRNNLVRLNPDASVDATFVGETNSTVRAIIQQPDRRLIIGGIFDTPQKRLARLLPDGQLDSTFAVPDFSGGTAAVVALARQVDGKLVIGGNFNTVAGVNHFSMARLNADGSVDHGFGFGTQVAAVNTLAVQVDGKVVAGGTFTQFAGITRNRVARFSAFDGSLDPTFDPNADGIVNAILQQGDGKLLVTGQFSTVGGVPRGHIARLYPDGNTDSTWNPALGPYVGDSGSSAAVYALSMQSDGKLLMGGDFGSVVNPAGGYYGGPNVARMDTLGHVDTGFAVQVHGRPEFGIRGTINAIVSQPDGKWLLAGQFQKVNETSRFSLAQLNRDYTVDNTFNPALIAYSLNKIALQMDGRFIVASGSENSDRLYRYNSNGTVDATYTPPMLTGGSSDNGPRVGAMFFQPDDKLIVVGNFRMAGGSPRLNSVRLNTNGTIDQTFVLATDAPIRAAVADSSGRIFIGGDFLKVNGVDRASVAKVTQDGSLDPGFVPDSFIDSVLALGLQADGRLLVQSNEKLIRYMPSGARDLTIANAFSFLEIRAKSFAQQSDGKFFVAGDMKQVAGVNRTGVARLSLPDSVASQILSLEGASVSWMRSGAAPELSNYRRPIIQISANGLDFTDVGVMSAISGGWRYVGSAGPSGAQFYPLGQNFYLRVRGTAISGQGGGSLGTYEEARQFFVGDRIFASNFSQ